MKDKLITNLSELHRILGAATLALHDNDWDSFHLTMTKLRDGAWQCKELIHEQRWAEHYATQGARKVHEKLKERGIAIDLADLEEML